MRSILGVATLTLALAGFPAWAGASHSERIYIANSGCRGHAYKPSGVTLACGDGNLYATGIAYREYGHKVTTATATIHLNACTPNCAAGQFHSYPGTLSFRDIVRCEDGRLYYSRASYKFTGPDGSGTAVIAPFEHCSRVSD